MDRPIIQLPQDMVRMQEIIWRTKPDLIIETGIAHGGSLVFRASILALLVMCDAVESSQMFGPKFFRRKMLGLDIDIRAHNRDAIKAHPMASSVSPEVLSKSIE
jgi:cephalosporin hydroxylase